MMKYFSTVLAIVMVLAPSRPRNQEPTRWNSNTNWLLARAAREPQPPLHVRVCLYMTLLCSGMHPPALQKLVANFKF